MKKIHVKCYYHCGKLVTLITWKELYELQLEISGKILFINGIQVMSYYRKKKTMTKMSCD